jgi:peptidyl-prolyl cis-trans isomerase C
MGMDGTQIKALVAQLAREPLVHFLALGLLVFLVLGDGGAPADRVIRVEEAQVARLAEGFSQTWQRAPRPDEIDGLIRDYIEEEVYYREAKRLGLDIDDPVVRRRLRSKMAFLAASEVENITPSEGELRAWMATNPTRYQGEASYGFDQVFVTATGDAVTANARANALLAQLNAGKASTGLGAGLGKGLGDSISLPPHMAQAHSTDIATLFGEAFATALARLPVGHWGGPVQSGFGLHLVRVNSAAPGALPNLADVRQRVENDWRANTKERRERAAYQVLLDAYDVKIEKPR